MANEDDKYLFPWGFNLGNLCEGKNKMPLFTESKEGGFCLLYDDASEKSADILLESLVLELLSSMPHESLKVDMFDTGRKKFYHLTPLQPMHLYEVAYNTEMMAQLFGQIEKTIISRHEDLLCCNRQTINEHNQKSRMKKNYHLVLLNIEKFSKQNFGIRRINNFIESAYHAGVYVIAFGNQSLENSEDQTVQAILNRFKTLKATDNAFDISPEVFEFTELLDTHTFEPLNLDKASILREILANGDLEALMDPEKIKLEENTKVL